MKINDGDSKPVGLECLLHRPGGRCSPLILPDSHAQSLSLTAILSYRISKQFIPIPKSKWITTLCLFSLNSSFIPKGKPRQSSIDRHLTKKKVSFTCPSPSPLIQSVSPSPQPVSMCICLDLDSIKRGTVLSRADVRYSFLQGKRTHRTAKLIDDWDDDPRRLSPPFDQDLSDPSGFKPSPFYSLAATLCKIDLSKSLRTFLLCLVNPGAVGSKNFLEFKVLSCIVLPQPRSISVDHAVPDSTVV